jgi:hypothetical protein
MANTMASKIRDELINKYHPDIIVIENINRRKESFLPACSRLLAQSCA